MKKFTRKQMKEIRSGAPYTNPNQPSYHYYLQDKTMWEFNEKEKLVGWLTTVDWPYEELGFERNME